MHLATCFDKYALCCMPLWWGLAPKGPKSLAPKTCAPVQCDSVSYVEEVRAYLCFIRNIIPLGA
jgi:hypothetical protein